MSASSTCRSLTVCNIGVSLARCTGFTKIHGQNDYSYIIDVEWTDERAQSVKRRFTEFQQLHQNLCKLFPELKKLERSRLNLKSSIRDNVTRLFTRDQRHIAESREAVLDSYLIDLLMLPERIRHSNAVISFFEPRATDPKPCKSTSPSEKSDSGIDLSGESTPNHQMGAVVSEAPQRHTVQHVAIQHNGSEEIGVQCSPDEHYLDLNCHVQAECYQPSNIDDDNIDDYATDEYDDETETETDEDSYDEDYFLDVGYGDLMLQSQVSVEEEESVASAGAEAGPESMWCSNLDKFSNILRSSMSNLHTASNDAQAKSYRTLTSIEEPDDPTITETFDADENSETESQQCGAEDSGLPIAHSPEDSSDDDCKTHKLAKTNLKNYYLSTSNLNMLE